MNNYLIKNDPQKEGLFDIISESSSVLNYIRMSLLRLQPGQSVRLGGDANEYGIVINSGCLSYSSDDVSEKLQCREDQFTALPHCIYVPAETPLEIVADSSLQAAIYYTNAQKGNRKIQIVKPEDLEVLGIGTGNWKIQGFFIVGKNIESDRLIVGETWIPEGHWSSCPPHSHDKQIPNVESKLEEIYYFRFKPKQGFGFQAVYTDDLSVDEAYRIHDEDMVMVPKGYHPNVAGPGYEMRMQWGMAGPEKSWLTQEDPAHAWIAKDDNVGGVKEHNF